MTVKKLIELLNKAISDGVVDPNGEILASTVNGCWPEDEDQMFEAVEEDPKNSIYILISHPEDNTNTIFYTVKKEEEN
jgi:hypothetical protein